MKKWNKPELFVEEFELEQSVAAGCGNKTNITVVPGKSVTVGLVCVDKSGKGHWNGENIDIKDDNNNGKIDYQEMVKYVGSARNGELTGQGHSKRHGLSVVLNGSTTIRVDDQPFTS